MRDINTPCLTPHTTFERVNEKEEKELIKRLFFDPTLRLMRFLMRTCLVVFGAELDTNSHSSYEILATNLCVQSRTSCTSLEYFFSRL